MARTGTDATVDDAAATVAPPSGQAHVWTDPTVVLVPLLALVTVLVMSTPGWVPLVTVLIGVAWVVLGVIWVAHVVGRLRSRRDPQRVRRPFASVVVYPGFLAIVLVLAASSIPLRARFALSRDEMGDAAAAVLTAGATVSDGTLGSFPMESIETDGHAVWFVTTGLGTADRWGFVYAPEGAPDQPRTTVLALDGGWYAFHEGDAAFPFL
jgi:hypothetical protein